MHVCLNKHACVGLSHGYPYAAIAALPTVHSGRMPGSGLELLRWLLLLQHGKMHKRREGVAHTSLRPAEPFMHACLRPTEAACFRVQKCANNRPLIVDGIQRVLQYACAAPFRIV